MLASQKVTKCRRLWRFNWRRKSYDGTDGSARSRLQAVAAGSGALSAEFRAVIIRIGQQRSGAGGGKDDDPPF